MKYPRTYHLPYSLGVSKDDRFLSSYDPQYEVVVTLKLDGENTSMTRESCYARSLESQYHESRSLVRSIWGSIKHLIPNNYQLVVENMYAYHSIYYTELPSYVIGFAIIDSDKFVMSWDDTEYIFNQFGITLAPVLYRGLYNEEIVRSCYKSDNKYYGGDQEGFVVRPSEGFSISEFSKKVGKFVRRDHVKTCEHWMYKPVISNKLR